MVGGQAKIVQRRLEVGSGGLSDHTGFLLCGVLQCDNERAHVEGEAIVPLPKAVLLKRNQPCPVSDQAEGMIENVEAELASQISDHRRLRVVVGDPEIREILLCGPSEEKIDFGYPLTSQPVRGDDTSAEHLFELGVNAKRAQLLDEREARAHGRVREEPQRIAFLAQIVHRIDRSG